MLSITSGTSRRWNESGGAASILTMIIPGTTSSAGVAAANLGQARSDRVNSYRVRKSRTSGRSYSSLWTRISPGTKWYSPSSRWPLGVMSGGAQ